MSIAHPKHGGKNDEKICIISDNFTRFMSGRRFRYEYRSCGNRKGGGNSPTNRKNLLAVDGVKDTRVFIYDDCALIAVRPGKQLQKTQTEKLENNITDLMNQKYPQFTNVKVTFSVKVFLP